MEIILTEREKYTVLRRRKKLRLKDVADHVGVDQSTFSKWEAGKYIPPHTMKSIEQYKEFIEEYEMEEEK